MKPLDDQIADASNLIAILLVFVFGYFSAIWPQLIVLLDEPAPTVAADRRRLASRLHAYQNLLLGLGLLVVAVVALLAPPTWQILAHHSWTGPYHVLRAGLVLVDLLLLSMLAIVARTISRLSRRRGVLSRPT
jgi:O-antigen/teichoic acid export membrane protein